MQRRAALRAYLLEVVRDLVTRGVVRQQAGQSLVDVLKTEPRAVLAEVQADIVTVAAEIGVGLLGGLEMMAKKHLDTLVGGAARAAADFFAAGGRRRG